MSGSHLKKRLANIQQVLVRLREEVVQNRAVQLRWLFPVQRHAPISAQGLPVEFEGTRLKMRCNSDRDTGLTK